MSNQKDQVMNYMSEFGTITPFQAFTDLGITKLATRISELTAECVPIYKKWTQTKNRYGKTVQFMTYSLKPFPEQ